MTSLGRITRSLFVRIPDWMLLFLFCGLLLTQTILSLREKSATYDETVHLPAGHFHLKFGNYSFNPEHPPLVKMFAALPLLFVEVKMPSQGEPFGGPSKYFRFGHRFLYEENDGDRLLFLGRMAVLPLTCLLACIVFLWTKQFFGRKAALMALFLYSLEPNMLAHAGLVNTDLGAASFILITIYAFYRLVHQISIPHLLFACFAFGLALIVKFSTLTLLPMLILLGGGVVVSKHPIDLRLPGVMRGYVTSRLKKLLILLAAMIGMALVAYMTIWVAYRFRNEAIVLPGQSSPPPWDQTSSDQPWIKRAILWMKDAKVLPEAYLYRFATAFQSLNRPSFLMGELSTEGWWYYFIVSFVLKTPLPLVLFLLVTPFSIRPFWRMDPVAVLCLVVPGRSLLRHCLGESAQHRPSSYPTDLPLSVRHSQLPHALGTWAAGFRQRGPGDLCGLVCIFLRLDLPPLPGLLQRAGRGAEQRLQILGGFQPRLGAGS